MSLESCDIKRISVTGIVITSSFARFTRSATSPSFAYVSNSAPDSSLSELLLPDCVRFSCCSPIASIRFNCCSPFESASVAARHLCLSFSCYCVHYNCSPIAFASAVAPRLRPLQLLLRLHLHAAPRLRPL